MYRFHEVFHELLSDIKMMRPNEKIASRNKLCNKYLVSRTTVDRAIADLVREGYLYTVKGGGTYVADLHSFGTAVKQDVVNVGVLISDIVYGTYSGLLHGLQDVFNQHDINTVIYNSNNDLDKQRIITERLLKSSIAAMIIVPVINSKDSSSSMEGLVARKPQIPIVLCNRPILDSGLPVITSNNYYGGYLATKHLIDAGYQRISYISSLTYQASTARYHGYLAALCEAGRTVDYTLIKTIPELSRIELGYQMTQELIREQASFDAIFCFNDRLACGAANAVIEHGLRISDDVGIIGYDNSELCYSQAKPLSSVSYMMYEIGQEAARRVVAELNGAKETFPEEVVFQPQLIVRRSSLGPRPTP
jgi:DNA-binding LacI/PurR family transcriptional regulator